MRAAWLWASLALLVTVSGSQGQSVFHDHVSPVDRPNLPAQLRCVYHLQPAVIYEKGAIERAKLLSQLVHGLLLLRSVHDILHFGLRIAD